ncbi:F-box domain containing protein [Tanacetum coccineum]
MERPVTPPGKKVLRRITVYFPIILDTTLYKSSYTAKYAFWHATGKCTEPVQAYSMWPMILTTYNLPPNLPSWLCMKESSFMLTLLIPSPKSSGKDIDVYLRPLIEDLKVLWDREGVETIDVASGQKFNMRAMACPTCNEDTPSVRVLSKTAYVGHRRFLKKPHKWRRSLEFNGQTDNTDPPKEFGRDVIMAQLDRLPTRVKGKHSSYGGVKIKRNVHVELNWTKRKTLASRRCELQEILEFKYLLFKVALFRVKWFDTSNKGRKVKKLVLRNNMTQIDCSREAFKDDQYILVTQVKQVFYLEDKTKPHWKVVEHVNHKKFSDGGVIVVEDDPDIIHFDNSSDLPLSTSLNDLDNATLHIDGQSTVVDAPPDIIDMSSADVARSYKGDGGGDDRPSSYVVPTVAGCFFRTNNRTSRKLKAPSRSVLMWVINKPLNPPRPMRHGPNYIGEVVRSVPLYYPSWEKVPKERKAAIISNIGTLFDLRPHMESSRWTEIYEGINMHLQKAYNTNKASFKAKHWKADPTTGSYDVEAIRRARPEEITAAEWDKYIQFWNDPKNLARAAQNRLNRQKSVVSTGIPRQASDTQEYPSLIDTFWRTHTVDGVFPKDEDRRIYEEMKRLEATGEYTEDEINALARGGKLRGHIPGVGRVLPSRATSRPSMPAPDKSLKSMHRKVDFMMSLFRSDSKYSDMFKEFESGGASGSGGCGDDEESGDDEDGEDEDDDDES